MSNRFGDSLENLARDARRAARRLNRDRSSSLAAVFVVGLAVAAVGSVLAIAEAFLLRPLPGVAAQEELVNVHRRELASGELERFTWREVGTLAAARGARGIAAYTDSAFVLDAGGTAEPVTVGAMVVSASYFDVLGTRPARGRGFLPHEEVLGAVPVAVIGHALWQTRLGGDEGIVGREILLDGRPVTVVGVAPQGFSGTFFAFPFDVWLPVGAAASVAPQLGVDATPAPQLFELTARRAAGVARDELAAELETLDSALRPLGVGAQRPEGRWTIDVRPLTGLDDNIRGGIVALISLLAGGALLLLAVAGLNIGGVLLARGVGRARETAIEVALGAGSAGILRAHVVETLILFAAGAALGVWGAYGATALLRNFEPPFAVPLVFDVTPRPATLAAAIGVALLAGLAVALLPARQALRRRSATAGALQGGTRGTAAAEVSRTLRVVVALEVALAIVLLVAAGLFLRSVGGARAIDPGFAMDGRWVFRVGPATAGLDPERRAGWFAGLAERLTATPGIEAVGQNSRMPLGLGSSAARAEFVAVAGAAAGPVGLDVDTSSIDAGYLPAVRIPIVAGRNFDPGDVRADALPAAIVNETLARRLVAGAAGGAPDGVAEAVGRRVTVDGTERVVVGVARDSKVRRLWETPRPLVHLPARGADTRRSFVVVSSLSRAALVDLVAREVRAFDPAVPRPAPLSFAEHAAISLLPQRLAGAVATTLGLVCLAVAAAGLYGLFAFWVAARTHEIGIRRALGASDRALEKLVLGQCVRQLAAGAALGLPLAIGVGYLLRGMLVGVEPFDPVSLAAGLAVLAAAAALAGWFPLRRALRVEPAVALRQDGAAG